MFTFTRGICRVQGHGQPVGGRLRVDPQRCPVRLSNYQDVSYPTCNNYIGAATHTERWFQFRLVNRLFRVSRAGAWRALRRAARCRWRRIYIHVHIYTYQHIHIYTGLTESHPRVVCRGMASSSEGSGLTLRGVGGEVVYCAVVVR